MTRVVVVDDQTLVRQGIRSLLEVADIAVVGEAADGRDALDVIAAAAPDVVLMDLRMPGYDGIWALDQLRATDLAVPVLVLTTFDDDELVLEALRAGARGYLLKDVTLEQLTRAVHTLADGARSSPRRSPTGCSGPSGRRRAPTMRCGRKISRNVSSRCCG